MKKNELGGLTGLRFFAAIHVVLFHNIGYLGFNLEYLPHSIRTIIGGGEHAVSLFFILSGFILTYNYQINLNSFRGSIKRFYISRYFRIYPLYIIAFGMDLPRGLIYFGHQYAKMAVTSLSHITLTQSWHPRLTAAWNFPGWSISTEFFFYLCFPFILPWILKRKKNHILFISFYLLPLIIFSFIQFVLKVDTNQAIWITFLRSFPIYRLPEFIIGIIIGKIYLQNDYNNAKPLHIIIFALSVILSLFLLFIPTEYISGHVLGHLFLVPLFCLIIYLLPIISLNANFLKNKFLILLGNSSYGMYIIHIPLLYYFNLLFRNPNAIIGISYIISLIMISIFLFKHIENPIQKLAKNLPD